MQPPPAPTISSFAPTAGSPGDPVTITGTGLTNASSVTFGGAAASYTVGDDMTIHAVVPVAASTGSISVTTPGGTATSADTFTVSPATGPTLLQHALAKGKSINPTGVWSQATAGGDLLVAAVAWGGGGTITPPPSWSLVTKTSGTAIFAAQGAASESGPVTFSISLTGTWVIDLMEWSGVMQSGAVDKTATNTSGSAVGTTADSGTTAVTSQPSEVAVAAIRALAAVTESNPTNGFALVDAGSQASNTLGAYEKVLSTTGAQKVAVTLSLAAKWRGTIATFRGA